MKPLTVGSLFAGIGGFDLGFERAGFEIRWQIEIDPWARAVLAKHWPHVYRHDDIRTAGAHNLEAVDVLCGGFPCQDISLAGKGAGIAEGTRSGLWAEYARLIRELRPRYVVVENVAALLARGRGFGRVLGDLATCGYDAEWDCIPASAVGAPHERDRVWLIAYPGGQQHEGDRNAFCGSLAAQLPEVAADVDGQRQLQPEGRITEGWRRTGDGSRAITYAHGAGFQEPRHARAALACRRGIISGPAPHRSDWWAAEPNVVRVVYGVPARVDRLRGLGNAVVPQIPEWIARRILDAEAARLTEVA